VEEKVSAEELAKIYVKIRDAKEAKANEFETELAKYQEQLDMVADKMLELCKEQDATSIRTNSGTIIRRVAIRYWTNDWDSMYKFIKEHEAYGLLERRLHQTNMRQFLEENPDLMPPGTLVDSKYTVIVRRS
jgi:hypothetical protein